MVPRERSGRRLALLAILALGPGLSAWVKPLPSQELGHDAQTEARREQDCSNPRWKTANLGLWYNLCQTSTY